MDKKSVVFVFLVNEQKIEIHALENILLGLANDTHIIKFTIDESVLTREIKEVVDAWEVGIKHARE